MVLNVLDAKVKDAVPTKTHTRVWRDFVTFLQRCPVSSHLHIFGGKCRFCRKPVTTSLVRVLWRHFPCVITSIYARCLTRFLCPVPIQVGTVPILVGTVPILIGTVPISSLVFFALLRIRIRMYQHWFANNFFIVLLIFLRWAFLRCSLIGTVPYLVHR